MLIFLILVCLLVVGVILFNQSGHSSPFEILGGVLIVISTPILAVALITLPTNFYTVKSQIEQFKITEITYKNARLNNILMENAAIQIDVATQNRWLVGQQYWNGTIFDIWIPNEIMDLKLLR